jgi:2-haloacid dehalogenase
MTVKALTFDIIGTVFDWFGSFSARVPLLAQKYGLSLNPSAFATGAEDGYASGVAAVNGGGPWTPPDEILRSSITALLSAGHTPSQQEIDDFFEIWQTLNPWSDVVSSLYPLHSHFTLTILSNMSVATQSSLMNHAGLPFDHALSGETVQAYKPNPKVYQMAIAKLGLQPDEILMVAAHKYDLDAAKAQGLRTAFVARPLELGPGGQVDTTPNPAYDFNVTSLTELVHELGADPPTLQEDCIGIDPNAVQVRQIGGSWKVVDGTDEMLDFGVNQANAVKAKNVISNYKFDRMCFVGRPDAPMMYFTVNASAPAGPMSGEDAIAFDLANLQAEESGGSWIVTDGSSRMLDFAASQFNALHAVALIRYYGFTHQCFVGRPNAPMMYFRK